MSLYTSVLSGIEALGDVDPRDEACVELALSYARAMENGALTERAGFGIDTLGPKLLACLVQLRMTPQSRTAALGGNGASQTQKVDPLDEIRQRRARHLGA